MSDHMNEETLRKFSERVVRVFERPEQQHPAIAMFESTIVPAAKAYMNAFDALRNFDAIRSKAMTDGRNAIRELYKEIRVWVGALERDVPGFESGQLIGDPRSPDHVLGDAKRLTELVTEHRATLPYTDALLGSVAATLTVAQKEWPAAQDVLAKRQELQANVRSLGAAVQRELVAFRRTLREVLGSSHRDYQNLRPRRVAGAVVDDPAAVTTPNAVDTSASPGNALSLSIPTQPEVGVQRAVAE